MTLPGRVCVCLISRVPLKVFCLLLSLLSLSPSYYCGLGLASRRPPQPLKQTMKQSKTEIVRIEARVPWDPFLGYFHLTPECFNWLGKVQKKHFEIFVNSAFVSCTTFWIILFRLFRCQQSFMPISSDRRRFIFSYFGIQILYSSM